LSTGVQCARGALDLAAFPGGAESPMNYISRMVKLRTALLPVIATLTACVGSTDPSRVELSGCWAEVASIPGSALSLELTENGTTIGGSGTFFIEAGPHGTLAASGERTGAKFTLQLSYDIGLVRRVDATIRSAGEFEAMITDVPWQVVSGPVEFRRCSLE